MKFLLRLLFLVLMFMAAHSAAVSAQSNPAPLVPDVSVQRVMTIRNGAVRMVNDRVQEELLYTTTSGNIYKVLGLSSGSPYDSLVYTAADHGVSYVQGMVIHDSILYVSGNNASTTPKTVGVISRGVLQPNGSRSWSFVMQTDSFETGDYFDHLLSGIAVSNDGDSIAFCIGARGDHGEIQDRYGRYPGLRNVPLTAKTYLIPARDTAIVFLPNDSALLAVSPYLLAEGTRNHFDMAYDGAGRLFGVENSGDRDDGEEMNWLRRGRHYGFPWEMGLHKNPQQYPGFVPANDKLIPHYSRTWRLGFWYNDPGFPQAPAGITFEPPMMNIGPDADKFRDSLTGNIIDASDAGVPFGTFTAHRSPLGLVFDNDSTLSSLYNGDAFMLSWTPGYDSCGCTSVPDTGIGPFVDPSQDLLHLDLHYDSLMDNFYLGATRIVGGFSRPVDADIDSNTIWVIEFGYAGVSGLYKVTLPAQQDSACVPPANDFCSLATDLGILPVDSCGASTISVTGTTACASSDSLPVCIGSGLVFPGDVWYQFTLNRNSFDLTVTANRSSNIGLYGGTDCQNLISLGCLMADTVGTTANFYNLWPGTYLMNISGDSADVAVDFQLDFIFHPLEIRLDSIIGTSCIGCTDGLLYCLPMNGAGSYAFTMDGQPVINNYPISGLSAGLHTVCITDSNNCVACDTIVVPEDPTGVMNGISSTNILKAYPSPANDYLTVELYDAGAVSSLLVVDLLGKAVFEKGVTTAAERLDISSLIPGIYFLLAKDHSGRLLTTQKIRVE